MTLHDDDDEKVEYIKSQNEDIKINEHKKCKTKKWTLDAEKKAGKRDEKD